MTAEQDRRALRNVEAAHPELDSFAALTLEAALRAAILRAATIPAGPDNPHRIAAEAAIEMIRAELEKRRRAYDAALETAAGIESMQFQPDDDAPRRLEHPDHDEQERRDLDALRRAESAPLEAAHITELQAARRAASRRLHATRDTFGRKSPQTIAARTTHNAISAEITRRQNARPIGESIAADLRPEPTTHEGETAHDLARQLLEQPGASWRVTPDARRLAELVLAADTLEEIPPFAPIPGEPDTFAGMLRVAVSIALDVADGPITTQHELARVLLECADTPLQTSRVVLELERDQAQVLAGIVDFGGVDNDNLSGFERSTAEAIADTLRDALK